MRSHPTLRRIRPANIAAFLAGVAVVVAIHVGGLQPILDYLVQAAMHTRVIFLVIVAALLGVVGLGSAVLALRHLERPAVR